MVNIIIESSNGVDNGGEKDIISLRLNRKALSSVTTVLNGNTIPQIFNSVL